MLSLEQNDLLCRVNADAPMGSLMKRYWLPACLAEEVAQPGGAPVRVRLVDEDLVIFRSPDGSLGALEEYCPHRGVSLALARNENTGLRCLYHGWKFAGDGRIVEMPTEPADSKAKDRLCHRSYPVRESGGMIWAYLGPADAMPAFQPPPWAECSGRQLLVYKFQVDANWAQALEGQIDSAHSSSLHSSDIRASAGERTVADGKGGFVRPSGDMAPQIQVKRTSYGMRYVAVRRPTADAGDRDYMRVTVFVAPCFALIPPNNRHYLCNIAVPRDDDTTMMYFVRFSEGADIDPIAIRAASGVRPGVDIDANYRPIRTRENKFLQDREAMAHGNFSGIGGIANQDVAMWTSMGRTPIVDRTKEHLGGTDVAVVQFRRLMLDAVDAFRTTSRVLGQEAPCVPFGKIRSYEGMVPKGGDWERLGLSEDELALAHPARRAETRVGVSSL